ncbi:MAG: hypothetical protein WDA29_10410 [Flavobacteriaceae bacterium]
MSLGCREIANCILKNCSNLVPGIKDRAYFINYNDINKDDCTFSNDNALLLTSLVLKTASPPLYAYCVDGYNFSNEHSVELVKKTYQKVWDHNFIFRIFDNTPEVKLWIQDAVDSRFVVVIENNYNKEGEGRTVFEVLGWDRGLELNAAERNVTDDEMLGGWVLTAGCSDNIKESLPPLTLFASSLSDTRSLLESLLAPCCDGED